ncbi:CoB--CoM heterodisulfide reductase iron-sulfur subunit B family protein [Desulfovibrio inopinatus]|uniref:CoB--CoM heterodisulfide reductase iron-sulfur subunit B family protein n=1 Tax=Desulfovibrio inopinatus TaxID=102109 RepID=UPI0003FE9B3C|nr:CoB--CoM heterodisulfide reductase iron-sulfur subunit B family protein [Desulfovibrio inopinatus]
MKYAYYPGCSLTGTASEYDVSTRAILAALDIELTELSDWTCCGAAAVESVSHLLAYALPARNVALAETQLPGQDILAPCSACYLTHLRVVREAEADKGLKNALKEIMSSEGLDFQGKANVRHLLDVLVTDVGEAKIRERVTHPLTGLQVAPYYGCQAIRPYRVFDDPERPEVMTGLVQTLGADVIDWDMGGRCCGASLMTTKKNVALPSVARILRSAREADVVVTVCPMCQMNLEAYQKEALQEGERKDTISILYLPQLVGLAFGMKEEEVMLGKNMAVNATLFTRIEQQKPTVAPSPT